MAGRYPRSLCGCVARINEDGESVSWYFYFGSGKEQEMYKSKKSISPVLTGPIPAPAVMTSTWMNGIASISQAVKTGTAKAAPVLLIQLKFILRIFRLQ